MPVFIISPYLESGAPESLHQLCHQFNKLGVNSFIYYLNKPVGKETLYKEFYPFVKEAEKLEDNSVIVYFEILTYKDIETKYNLKNCQYMLWWLSINNALLFRTTDVNVSNPEVIHLFHGDFIKNTVVPLLTSKHKWYYLHDYIDTSQFKYEDIQKEDIIAYNPSKDFISGPLLVKNNYKTLPLNNLTRKELIEQLSRCKLYIDLGAHSGRDRLPREAALLGCIIVTSNFCSANTSDIDIADCFKMRSEKDTLKNIDPFLESYSVYLNKQQEYRDSLLLDEKRMVEQLKYLLEDFLSSSDKLLSYITYPNDYDCFYNYYKSGLELFQECNSILELGISHTKNLISEFANKSSPSYITSIYIQNNYEKHLIPHIICNTKINYRRYICNPLEYVHHNTVDILAIDTWNIYGQLQKELKHHSKYITKYIIIYNTHIYRYHSINVINNYNIELEMYNTGFSKEEIEKGLYPAIEDFIKENPKWKIHYESTIDNGYTVLSCNE